MERMARDAVETIKITARAMRRTRGRFRQWIIPVFLSLAAAAFARRLQTAAAIALALLAYYALTTDWGRYPGPYAGIAARVVRTQMLFIEDSAGRARAWLGVEDEFDDEIGPRLVFYDEQGRARLGIRLADLRVSEGAEVVPGQALDVTYLPPPRPPGKPPKEEEEVRLRTEHAARAAAVHVQMQSEHASDWAMTHSGARRGEQEYQPEDAEREQQELLMFDKSGKESVSLASGLRLADANGFASVTADSIFLMSDGQVLWEAPSPPTS